MPLGSLRNAAKWRERGRVDLQGFCAGARRNYSRSTAESVARLQPPADRHADEPPFENVRARMMHADANE
jgi:hypothetical protein